MRAEAAFSSSGDSTAALDTAAAEVCPICRDNTTSLYDVMYDDRYGYPGCYRLRRCNSCGHIHLSARFDESELINLYTKYYPRAAYSIEQHRIPPKPHGVKAWLRGDRCSALYWVPERVRVLDIGCGYCESLGYHRARGCEVFGVEADENARKVAQAFGYNVHIGLFDPSLYEREYFDVVTLDQVIEHVTDPEDFLAKVANVLKPGGLVIVSTPNPSGLGRHLFRRRWIHWHIPYHLQYFTRRSMDILAQNAGLEVSKTLTLTHSEWLHFQLMHLVSVPPCGEPHPFWTGKAWKTTKARLASKVVSVMHDLRLHQLVSRALDAAALGDNRLFFLRKPDQGER